MKAVVTSFDAVVNCSHRLQRRRGSECGKCLAISAIVLFLLEYLTKVDASLKFISSLSEANSYIEICLARIVSTFLFLFISAMARLFYVVTKSVCVENNYYTCDYYISKLF